MSREHEQLKICEYLYRHLEKEITPAEQSELKQYLQDDPDGMDLYMGIAQLYAQLSTPNKLTLLPREADSDISAVYMKLLEELSDDELNAETVVMPQEDLSGQLIEKVSYPSPGKRHFNKLSWCSIIFSTAAVIFLVIFIRFVPPNTGYEVATLVDSIDAKWAGTNTAMQSGTRLLADKTLFELRKGLIELEFDTQASVVIEAPAEFQILADDRIGMNYGKIYANVPSEAIGFSIYTQNAKVIDMGTEFGVQVDPWGETCLHVIKGKTMLIAGQTSNKSSIEVEGGCGKKISSINSLVSDIPCETNLFARELDSESDIIWRQSPSLDLADMVRKGNGLGTGVPEARLDPVKGFTTDWHNAVTAIPNTYLPILDHPFIDGVFVPDGESSQVVNTRGDVFAECPDTSGLFDVDLFANPKQGILKTDFREGTIRFNEKEYTDESGHSCIVMHANRGLTFDLDAVRRFYRRDIQQFTSQVGIADFNEDCPCNADFYVLVDGKIRYLRQQCKQKGVLNNIVIDINDTDRFLTLVTTDGGDPDFPEGGCYKRAISCDWGIFTEPVLILE